MARSFKASETLLGIETRTELSKEFSAIARFKASETLLGIETTNLSASRIVLTASKPLKPF